MSELDIHAAAREAGDRPAIVTATRAWTFAECAAAASASGDDDDDSDDGNDGADRGGALVAAPAVATILAIYGALAAGRPRALLHAKATAEERARQRATLAAAALPPETAFVLFTSGSTGASRGVVISRAAIVAAARASEARLGWRDDDAWLLALPLAHAGGLSIVVRCLIARRPIVLVERDADLAALLPHATLASFVPTQLATLIERAAPGRLRAIILGGAAAPPSLIAAALAAGWPVLGSYGLTETFGQIATARAPGGPLALLPGVEVACGETIEIRGPQLATRYLDGTPIAPRLVTADLGRLDPDGTLHVLGRRDDVIVSGGEKVHPLEVEAVLAATPGVRAACVFGVADPRWGQVVAAALAVGPGFDRTAALAAWHARLAPHARPRRIAELAALPLLPSSKLDRRAIAALPTTPVEYPIKN